MIGGPVATGYSCTIANDGDATSRGSAPSSVAIARARNVFPAPRSPTRWTVASGGSMRAISRPAAAVSDSVEQTKRRDCIRKLFREIVRRQAGVAHLFFQSIAGEAVKIRAGARGFEWIDAAGKQRDDDAAEDVAH